MDEDKIRETLLGLLDGTAFSETEAVAFARENPNDRVFAAPGWGLEMSDREFDSLDRLEIVMMAEEHWGITINDASASKIRSLNDLVATVQEGIRGAK